MLVVALPHPSGSSPVHLKQHDGRSRASQEPIGYIARYAQGADYHRVIRDKLHELANFIASKAGVTVRSRICVDTAPILEREAARRTGMAFIGKNTLAIIPGLGSAFLLGVMLLDVDLVDADASTGVGSTGAGSTGAGSTGAGSTGAGSTGAGSTGAGSAGMPATLADGCGSCTACLDACPTQAFIAPHQLDARRCISYLTIELKGAIDRELRTQLGNHVFGCDQCQDVCPYNKAAKARTLGVDLPPLERLQAPTLASWLGMTATDYRRLVKGTALKRTTRQRFQRNAAVALGNAGDPVALPQLIAQLHGNRSALVRQHCAWAVGKLGGTEAMQALEQASHDPDADVTAEARRSLQELQAKT
jgi:epoxyqueuosine reductase